MRHLTIAVFFISLLNQIHFAQDIKDKNSSSKIEVCAEYGNNVVVPDKIPNSRVIVPKQNNSVIIVNPCENRSRVLTPNTNFYEVISPSPFYKIQTLPNYYKVPDYSKSYLNNSTTKALSDLSDFRPRYLVLPLLFPIK